MAKVAAKRGRFFIRYPIGEGRKLFFPGNLFLYLAIERCIMSAVAATKPLTSEANGVELAERRRYLFENVEKNCPDDSPLTDEEIQEEVNMARYGNKYGKPNRNWEKDLALLDEAYARAGI